MDSEDLGRALVALRAGARLSQEQVAREAEVAKVQISRYEVGTDMPSTRSLHRLLRALGVVPQEFYTLRDILTRAQQRRRGELGFDPPVLRPNAPSQAPAPTKSPLEEAGQLIAQGLLLVAREAHGSTAPPGSVGPRSLPPGGPRRKP